MIGLDTNVLVRYITQDDAAQAARAGQIIDQLSETRPGYITVVVLAEMYWVLRRAYRAESVATLTVLEGLVNAREIVVQHADSVRRAFRRARGGADFADALISELGLEAGCDHTVTFDRKAAAAAGMRLL